MIVDTNIQALPNIWGTRVGADIGGKAPSAYGITQGTPCNLSAALFRTSGEPYSDWLAYSERWIPPGAPYELSIGFDAIVISGAIPLNCSVIKR